VKPDLSSALAKVAQVLLAQLGPELRSDYAQRSALIAALLLQAAAEESERAAARRVEENAELRALFRAALPAVAEAGLRARLAAAAAESDGDLRLSALEGANCALRALLVELHAHVEEQAGAAAREVEERIWRELRRSTERRALSIAPF
jgi:hypothetical protein